MVLSVPTFPSRSRGLLAAALLAVVGACSSTIGPSRDGGGDDCFHPAPTDSPFGCKPTYAEQVPALCAMEIYSGIPGKRAGTCESFQVTLLTDTQNYWVWCIYDTEGALVGASRCSEGFECNGSACVDSAGARNVPRCEPPGNACSDGGT